MIILHAGFCEGRFFLWGEAPVELKARLPKPREKKHPLFLLYDAGKERLLQSLKEAGLTLTARNQRAQTMIAWLPAVDHKPVASSSLVDEPPEPDAKAVLRPWTVTVLGLSPVEVVDFLCACVGKQVLAPGVVVGKDLSFWAMALRFAGALVARQQFLPGIGLEKGAYRARWRPVFDEADASRLVRLAQAVPHVCRALTQGATSSPQSPSVSFLSDFVGQIVDHLVRSAPPPDHEKRKKPPVFDSLHDQWLYALRSLDGAMEGEAAGLAEFSGYIQEWQRPIAAATAAPFRLCFRLEEPDGSPESLWHVRFLLQDVGDPSLLIPAQEAWSDQRRRSSVLHRNGFKGREYVLVALGQASRLCPRIERSLKKAAPEGYELDATGAHDFLTEKSWALEQAGFGVLLPAWWTRKGTKLRLSARANVKSHGMRGGSGFSLDSIVDFDWEVALGEEKLSFEELQALAKLKAPLVKVRGQWVQMSAEEIHAALDFWKKKSKDQATVREIVQMAIGGGKTPEPFAFEGVKATGWMADLLGELEGGGFEEIPSPDGFCGTLRPYQVRGYSWLAFLRRWGLGACLADDMGLGKTIQTLALIQRDWRSGCRGPVLLVCPTSVIGNWQREATRFTPELPVMAHHGLSRTKSAVFREEASKHALVISSYALLYRDFEILKNVPWLGVVLDEAQNIKNPGTRQAKAARAIETEYRIALTGTPVENHVGDLWSLMEFLNPGFLGAESDFKKKFFIPIQANRDLEAAERLKRVTGPFILRRLKTDKQIIADLPEKMEMKVFCTLTKEQASLYAAVVREAVPELDSAEGMERRGLILATLSKLKQVCNHPAQFLGDNSPIPGRSGKLNRLTEMLEEILEVGDRALVFSQFAEMGELLRRHLQETFGREALFLHGGVTKNNRDRMVERFQGNGGPEIFILSLKAGGTGLNLTAANHVFHFDRWWNPAVENQATDRAFRIGQTKQVQVHKFLCAGTLEEKIDEMIERKKEVAEGVIGKGEGWLTELSTGELREIFALRREAVGD